MPPRILLCDDEFPITKAASLKLAKAGFAVRTCHDGEAGWEAYRSERPDLLVTDLQMPRLDGLGLIRRIRGGDAALPIVLLTAKGYELDEPALKAEFAPFRLFAKPFSPRELAETVGEMLAAAPAFVT
ncbi:MAG TPA: response regulator [Planctomycetaceae bacterium]